MTKHYDYILAGGGLAGLSLACHLVKSPLRDRSILIVDPDTKEHNDRTWSYWTRQPGLFDGAVTHTWDNLRFVGNGVETVVPLGEYRYKTIRGDDFYRFARQLLAASQSVHPDRAAALRHADAWPVAGNSAQSSNANTGHQSATCSYANAQEWVIEGLQSISWIA